MLIYSNRLRQIPSLNTWNLSDRKHHKVWQHWYDWVLSLVWFHVIRKTQGHCFDRLVVFLPFLWRRCVFGWRLVGFMFNQGLEPNCRQYSMNFLMSAPTTPIQPTVPQSQSIQFSPFYAHYPGTCLLRDKLFQKSLHQSIEFFCIDRSIN